MPRQPLPPTPPPAPADSADELEAALYETLKKGDLEAFMALWADDDEIVCVHPGGGRVIGPQAIRASFEAIFSNGGIPVQVQQVHRVAIGDSALHHLVERLTVPSNKGPQTAWIIATNWYVRTPLGWRLASHHASPGPEPTNPAPENGGAEWSGTLH